MYPLLLGTVSVYLPMWGIAAVTCISIGVLWSDDLGLPRWRSALALVLLTMAIVIGARLLYLAKITFFPSSDYGPKESRAGVRIQGGILLLGIVLPLVATSLALPWKRFGDMMIPLAALAAVIVRFGCFLNGCCFGKVSNAPWALRFAPPSWVHWYHADTGWIAPDAAWSLPVHPLQLYFVFTGLGIFALLRWFQRRNLAEGHVQLLCYMLFFGSTALLEPFREHYAPTNLLFVPLAAAAWVMLLRGANSGRLQPYGATTPGQRNENDNGEISMTRSKWSFVTIALAWALLVPSPASGQPVAPTMTAEGTWASANDTRNGTWQAIFQVAEVDQTGRITIVAGDLAVVGMPELVQGAVVGSLQPNSIQFGIMYDNIERAAFTGVVNGINLFGNFRVTDGPSGRWDGHMTSMPGVKPAPTLAVTPEAPPVP